MEFPAWFREVQPNEILQIQDENEGRRKLGRISASQLNTWMCKYPKLVECDELQYEYNFLSKGLLIKCMPLPTHDSLQLFFT